MPKKTKLWPRLLLCTVRNVSLKQYTLLSHYLQYLYSCPNAIIACLLCIRVTTPSSSLIYIWHSLAWGECLLCIRVATPSSSLIYIWHSLAWGECLLCIGVTTPSSSIIYIHVWHSLAWGECLLCIGVTTPSSSIIYIWHSLA